MERITKRREEYKMNPKPKKHPPKGRNRENEKGN